MCRFLAKARIKKEKKKKKHIFKHSKNVDNESHFSTYTQCK